MSLGFPDRFCRVHGVKLNPKELGGVYNEEDGKREWHRVYYKCPRWFCVQNCEANGVEWIRA
jgi:hypothetical protein